MNKQRQPRLGLIRLSELFTDFKLCKNVVIENKGSHVVAPDGYKFVGGLRGPGPRGGSSCYINKRTYFLYGKPTDLAIETCDPNMMEGRVASFEIRKWDDKALVLGLDRVFIGTAWIAFVPLEDIPNPEVIELYPD